MKITESRTETHTETHETVVALLCDLCRMRSTGSRWTTEPYDIEKTRVSYKHGNSWPEGGHEEKVSFDICPSCFMQTLMPWLKAQGAQPTLKEYYW